MKYADFDYSKYPEVFIKMNPILPTTQEQKLFFADFERMLQMHDKAFVIFNSKDQKLISSEARIQAGQWMKSIHHIFPSKINALFFTEASIWLNMVLKAIFMINKPPVPIHVCNTLDDVKKILKESYGYEMK